MTFPADDEVAQTWPPSPSSVASARAQVLRCLRRWDFCGLENAGALIVSELATNAVRHAGTAFTVTLTRLTDGVVIRVNDGGAAPPFLSPPSLDALELGGRGMHLVDALSEGWGSVPDGAGGKAVWAILAAV